MGLVQGGDLRLDGQSSALSLTPLCGQPGISVLGGTRQASFLSLTFSYSPRAEAESSLLPTYSHTLFKLAPALVTIPQIWCLLASPLG